MVGLHAPAVLAIDPQLLRTVAGAPDVVVDGEAAGVDAGPSVFAAQQLRGNGLGGEQGRDRQLAGRQEPRFYEIT